MGRLIVLDSSPKPVRKISTADGPVRLPKKTEIPEWEKKIRHEITPTCEFEGRIPAIKGCDDDDAIERSGKDIAVSLTAEKIKQKLDEILGQHPRPSGVAILKDVFGKNAGKSQHQIVDLVDCSVKVSLNYSGASRDNPMKIIIEIVDDTGREANRILHETVNFGYIGRNEAEDDL